MLLKIRIPPSQWRAHLPTTPRRFHARFTSFILVTNPLPTREQILPKYGAFFHWWNRPWNENTFWMIVQVRDFDPHMGQFVQGGKMKTDPYEWQTWCFELCGCGVWSGYKTRQFRVMNSSKSDTANKLSICPVGIQLLPRQKWTRRHFFLSVMTVHEQLQTTQVLMFQCFPLVLRLYNINSIYCVRLITWAAEIQEIFHQSVRRQILHSSGGDLVFMVGGACKC